MTVDPAEAVRCRRCSRPAVYACDHWADRAACLQAGLRGLACGMPVCEEHRQGHEVPGAVVLHDGGTEYVPLVLDFCPDHAREVAAHAQG